MLKKLKEILFPQKEVKELALYAKAGEVIMTEHSQIPVYEVTRDIFVQEPIYGNDLKSLCNFPDPEPGEMIHCVYRDEAFAKYFETPRGNYFKFHFKDGWR